CPEHRPAAFGFWPVPTCDDGLCRVEGQRVVESQLVDTNSDGIVDSEVVLSPGDPGYATHHNLSAVLVGGVPFKELNTVLNLSRQNVFDGWGRQFTYAVTERLTRQEVDPD